MLALLLALLLAASCRHVPQRLARGKKVFLTKKKKKFIFLMCMIIVELVGGKFRKLP